MRVSVVVPTYRRPDLLGRCLAALDAQELDPADFEVIVADDAVSAESRRQVCEFARDARASVRYVTGGRAHGPAAARNAGWQAARSPIVAFTDDDCIPDRNWLAAGLAAFATDLEVEAVSGRVLVPLPDRPTDYERDAAGLERAEFVTANCFVRRASLEALGGFDERFTAAWREDSDLHFALLKSGRRIARAEKAIVVHPVRPAPWGVSLRQQRKTQFDALLYKKYPRLYRDRIRRVPPWDYYASVLWLLAAGVGLWTGSRAPSLASMLAWGVLTGRFLARRLSDTSRDPRHVAEMLATTALIPPLSVFWRLVGSWRFRVLFV
jgi:GT2 family glycosyltransferase